MSDLRARTTKQFFGVPDGEVYPRGFVAGDEVLGDLAKVAIEEGWAEKVSGDEPASTTDSSKQEAPAGEAKGLSTTNLVSGAGNGNGASIEIPEDWKSMKWFALKALAEKIAGRDVKDSDDAKAVVEAEFTKRAPKAA